MSKAVSGRLLTVLAAALCPVAPRPKPLKASRPDGPKSAAWVRSSRSSDCQCKPKRPFMKRLRPLAVAALLFGALGPALAADVTFPPGVRVGLTPLVGLSRAKTFAGFESE